MNRDIRPIRDVLLFWVHFVAGVLVFPLSALAINPNFVFTKIVDTTTPSPSGAGNFVEFHDWSIVGGRVVFSAKDAGPYPAQGIYMCANGEILTIANSSTRVPGTPSGVYFYGVGGGSGALSFDGSTVAFVGSSFGMDGFVVGIYLWQDGWLSKVADSNTPSPSGGGTFTSLRNVDVSNGRVVFEGQSLYGQVKGIYTDAWGGLTRVVDSNMPVPSGTSTFAYPAFAAISGQDVAFAASDSTAIGSFFIYKAVSGSIVTVADANTEIPGGIGSFVDCRVPSTEGGLVTFGCSSGIYAESADSLVKIVTPDDIGLCSIQLSDRQGDDIVLWGEDDEGCSHREIWTNLEGEFSVLVESGDSLDGQKVGVLLSSKGALDDGQIVFSGECALYVASLPYSIEPSPICSPHLMISQGQGGFTDTLAAQVRFSESIAAIGDLDGDAIGDMVVGATGDDGRGAVWTLFMNSDGTVKSHHKIKGTDPVFGNKINVNDFFGTGAAWLGDLGGGAPTPNAIAVGQAGEDSGTGEGSVGAVWIMFLDMNGLVTAAQQITDNVGGFPDSLDTLDEFGLSVAAMGDLGPGAPTTHALAVGTHHDDDAAFKAGAVWMLFLNSDGTVNTSRKVTSGTAGFAPSLLDSADLFGTSVAYLGDIGPGAPTPRALAVGAQLDDDGGEDQGAVWILFLNSDGTVNSHQKISNTAGNFGGHLDPFDFFGCGMSALGDFNGDGVQDIVVGAWGDDDGGPERGALWFLFLNVDGMVAGYKKLSSTQGGFPCEIRDNDNVGWTMAVLGDLNGGGAPELAVSAWGYRNGTGGVWVIYTDSTTVTGVESGSPAMMNRLDQCYPNPFNPSTTIRFSLARSGPVTLQIYDVSGRLVRTLMDQTMAAGLHEVPWNGQNSRGQSVASGVYFYRLASSGFTRTRKMVMLK